LSGAKPTSGTSAHKRWVSLRSTHPTNYYKLRAAFLFDRDPSRSRTGFADDPIAALADTPAAITPFAGLLDGRGGAVVVHGKSFAEDHSTIPCFARFFESERNIIDDALRPRRETA
jgi:hypothetical protein